MMKAEKTLEKNAIKEPGEIPGPIKVDVQIIC